MEDFDFGFSLVSTEEVNKTTEPQQQETGPAVSTEEFETLQNKLDTLLNLVNTIGSMQSEDDLYNQTDEKITRLEDKLDRLLELESTQVASALQEQGSSIRAVIDEVEERKRELDEKFTLKLQELEGLVVPLLKGLMKNPEKEYIYWPDRLGILQKQIDKVYSITRKE